MNLSFYALRAVSLALLSLTGALAFGADGAQTTSIFPNGNLEADMDGDRWPDAWPKGAAITWEEEAGNHFIRLTQTAAGAFTMTYVNLPLPTGVIRYQLSYRVRYAGIMRGAESWHTGRIAMHFKGVTGDQLKPGPKHPAFVGTQAEWQTKTQELVAPAGAISLEFMPSLMHIEAGALDLDDIVITPLP